MPVPGVAGIGDLAGGDLQGGEQGRGAMADIIVAGVFRGSRAAAAGSARSGPGPGPGISRPRTARPPCRAGSGKPDDVADLRFQLRIGGELEVAARQGCSPYSRHTSATFTFDRPSSAASSRDDQCVTPSRCGGGSSFASTIATSSVVRGWPGLGRSSSPPMPSAAYRFFQAITVGLDTRAGARSRSCPGPQPPAARSGPAAPAQPGSTATAATTPAPHDLAAEPPRPQSTP